MLYENNRFSFQRNKTNKLKQNSTILGKPYYHEGSEIDQYNICLVVSIIV